MQPQRVPGEGFRATTTATIAATKNNGGKSAKIITKPIAVPPPSEPEVGLTVSSGTGPQVTGKKKVAPPPPVALARIRELALAKEVAAASVKLPREKSTAGGSPSVKAAAPTVIAEGGGSGAEGANGGRASKLSHQASELDSQTVVALSPDNDGRSRDQQEALVAAVFSQAEESSASSEGTGVLSTSASKRRVKSRKEPAAAVAAAPTAVTLPARQPAPVLASQPDYLPAWPETANGYAPSPLPNYSTMTEPERTSWRQWLQDECKTSKAEEALLRAKVSKIHAEICNWINNYAHSI